MRSPDPPLIELGFYFDKLSGREAFRRLVESLVSVYGATPRSASVIGQFESPSLTWAESDSLGEVVPITNVYDLRTLLSDPTRFVRELAVEHATRIVPDAWERVHACRIRSASPGRDGNPVSLLIEGAPYGLGPYTVEIKPKLHALGAKVRATFIRLISKALPSYATITIEVSPEAPCDVRDHPQTIAFRDSYLAYQHFSEADMQEIRSQFPMIDYEDLRTGMLITSDEDIMRSGAGTPLEWQQRVALSAAIGQLIIRRLSAGWEK